MKDYIHLNGIEKRSKSRHNNSCTSRRVKTEQHSTFKEGNEPERMKDISIELPPQDGSAKKTAEENCSMMIKQEIMVKIQEERKRLADLETYL